MAPSPASCAGTRSKVPREPLPSRQTAYRSALAARSSGRAAQRSRSSPQPPPPEETPAALQPKGVDRRAPPLGGRGRPSRPFALCRSSAAERLRPWAERLGNGAQRSRSWAGGLSRSAAALRPIAVRLRSGAERRRPWGRAHLLRGQPSTPREISPPPRAQRFGNLAQPLRNRGRAATPGRSHSAMWRGRRAVGARAFPFGVHGVPLGVGGLPRQRRRSATWRGRPAIKGGLAALQGRAIYPLGEVVCDPRGDRGLGARSGRRQWLAVRRLARFKL